MTSISVVSHRNRRMVGPSFGNLAVNGPTQVRSCETYLGVTVVASPSHLPEEKVPFPTAVASARHGQCRWLLLEAAEREDIRKRRR
jgi:hypothetical protein